MEGALGADGDVQEAAAVSESQGARGKGQGREEKLLSKLRVKLEALSEAVDALEVFIHASAASRAEAVQREKAGSVDESKSAKFVRAFVKQGEEQRATGKKKSLSLEDRFCLALYQRGPLTREQLGYYTGISNTSGPANKAMRTLESDEIVTREAGRFVLDQFEADKFMPMTTKRASEVLDAFCEREKGSVEAIVRAILRLHQKHSFPVERHLICDEAGVSRTSGPTMKALRRLRTLGILESIGVVVSVSPWFLQANEPVVKVRDRGTGTEQLVNARTGMP